MWRSGRFLGEMMLIREGNKLGRKGIQIYRKRPVINARGIYLILGVQAGTFNRQDAFIFTTVTSSRKLIC